MNQSAFDSPDPGECFKYSYHGSATHRKVFTRPQSLGGQLFHQHGPQMRNFWDSKFSKKKLDVKNDFF